tara:strand:- start:735 stop:1127 length:393 start_codon:yes stop_codon:yes gene_type:complete
MGVLHSKIDSSVNNKLLKHLDESEKTLSQDVSILEENQQRLEFLIKEKNKKIEMLSDMNQRFETICRTNENKQEILLKKLKNHEEKIENFKRKLRIDSFKSRVIGVSWLVPDSIEEKIYINLINEIEKEI